MNTILRLLLIVSVLGIGVNACTTSDFIKTGLSNGKHDMTMYEYFETDSYNWDSTLLMIRTAGLEDLFRGTDSITFFGPTNHSIRRYMLENDIKRVEDMGADFCRETLLRHVMKGKVMREEFPRGVDNTEGAELVGEGGQVYTMLGGNQIWGYTFQEPYMDTAETGPIVLHVTSIDGKMEIPIASTDIEPNNGVVHSLGYDFTLGEM